MRSATRPIARAPRAPICASPSLACPRRSAASSAPCSCDGTARGRRRRHRSRCSRWTQTRQQFDQEARRRSRPAGKSSSKPAIFSGSDRLKLRSREASAMAKRFRIPAFLLAFVACCFAPVSLCAQTGQNFGELVGKVADDQGGVLPGVTVTLSGPAVMGAPTAVSGANGVYRFPAVTTGTYTLTFDLGGFSPLV